MKSTCFPSVELLKLSAKTCDVRRIEGPGVEVTAGDDIDDDDGRGGKYAFGDDDDEVGGGWWWWWWCKLTHRLTHEVERRLVSNS